jgi:hypothetical protein
MLWLRTRRKQGSMATKIQDFRGFHNEVVFMSDLTEKSKNRAYSAMSLDPRDSRNLSSLKSPLTQVPDV